MAGMTQKRQWGFLFIVILGFYLPPSSVIYALCFELSTNDTVRGQIKIRGTQLTTMPSK